MSLRDLFYIWWKIKFPSHKEKAYINYFGISSFLFFASKRSRIPCKVAPWLLAKETRWSPRLQKIVECGSGSH